MPETRVRELARDALVDLAPLSARAWRRTGAGSWPTTCWASRAAPRPRPRAVTCAAPRPPARGPARCSTRSSSSTRTARCRRSRRASAPRGPPRAPRSGRRRRLGGRRPTRRRVLAARRHAGRAGCWWRSCCGRSGCSPATTTRRRGSDRPRPRPPAGRATPRAPRWCSARARSGAVQVQATGLEPSTQKFAYQFWLYDSKGKARSLGAQVTDQGRDASGDRQPARRLREVPLLRPLARADRRAQGALRPVRPSWPHPADVQGGRGQQGHAARAGRAGPAGPQS